MKVKDFGQVFTPKHIVIDVLDAAGYYGENILKKHIIDNSCGDGAFLIEIIKRYIEVYKNKYNTYNGLKKELKKYIHGIEIDNDIYQECLKKIDNLINEYQIGKINFDIINDDALIVSEYNQKMDYVVGNPPYVRVHNLKEQRKNVKEYAFCEEGMTDLYIVFYEIGLKMLKKNGVLCYISPNSFYNSLAGTKLREYLKNYQNMELLIDLGHYQPFSVTTYTTICKICNNKVFENCQYFKYNIDGIKKFICSIDYDDLFIDNNIILSTNNKKYFKIFNYKVSKKTKILVKNGFATLNDDVFIQDSFSFEDNTIDIIKASTGKWKKCLYPYDKNGKLIPFEMLSENIQEYFLIHKEKLSKDKRKNKMNWYSFGRSQAIKDVFKKKYAINTTIKDIETIKLNVVSEGNGIYSGLYILTDIPFAKIKEKIYCNEFIDYLKIINKCKSGGYYTFSSKDLQKYLNYCLEDEVDE